MCSGSWSLLSGPTLCFLTEMPGLQKCQEGKKAQMTCTLSLSVTCADGPQVVQVSRPSVSPGQLIPWRRIWMMNLLARKAEWSVIIQVLILLPLS